MRYIEVPGEIDNHNRLILHESLEQIKPQSVKIDIVFRDDEEEYREPTKAEILESITEGLREVDRGEYLPISQMWDDIKIKTTGEINAGGQLVLDEPLKQTTARPVDVVMWFIIEREEPRQHGLESSDRAEREYLALIKEPQAASAKSYA
jgi:hypothetical protein